MKDLITYINEGIFDVDNNISKLDWENIDLVSILNIKTQEDWDNAYFVLKAKMNSESKPARSIDDFGQTLLVYEKGEIYINFDDRYNRIGFGTWDKSWDIAFKGNRTDIYKAAFGYGRLSYNTFKPYYMPKSLLPSYKKAIKLAKK
jgi:hypothetical protein